MSMVAVIRTPLLTVLVLPSGATEKPELACHEPHRHSMTQPSISHCHRHRLAIWYFSIPLTIPVTMLPMWGFMLEIIRCTMPEIPLVIPI